MVVSSDLYERCVIEVSRLETGKYAVAEVAEVAEEGIYDRHWCKVQLIKMITSPLSFMDTSVSHPAS